MKDLLTIDILILQEKNRGIMLKPNLDSKAINKPGSRYSQYSYMVTLKGLELRDDLVDFDNIFWVPPFQLFIGFFLAESTHSI